MIPIISAILTGGLSLVSNWVKHKSEMASARQLAELKWAETMADASKTSWKDEYVLLVWTLPVVAAIVGYDEPLRSLVMWLDKLPDWYTGLLVTLSLASFGLNAKGRWENLKSKREYNKNGGSNYPSPYGNGEADEDLPTAVG